MPTQPPGREYQTRPGATPPAKPRPQPKKRDAPRYNFFKDLNQRIRDHERAVVVDSPGPSRLAAHVILIDAMKKTPSGGRKR